tara:strand:+ start:202 stop:537 length:336 start_codon:yes stop_codon:yes gene_type:complete
MDTKPALERQAGGQHYKDMAIQPIEFCQKNGLNMCESNVIKYVSRHRKKNGREDIEKAIHMLEVLLELEYPLPASDMTGNLQDHVDRYWAHYETPLGGMPAKEDQEEYPNH